MEIIGNIDVTSVDYRNEVLIWCNDKREFFNEINSQTCFRFILIEEGTGIVNLRNKRITFNAPAVFCLDEAEKFTLERSANIFAKFMFFLPAAMNSRLNFQNLRDKNSELSFTERNDRTYLKPFYIRTEDYHGFMDIGINMSKRLSQLFNSIDREISEKKDGYWPCHTRSYFLELLLAIERLYSKHQPANYVMLSENLSEIDNILLYLHLNYNNKITISELTKKFNINRTSLNEQFGKAMDMPVMTYLIALRIKFASTLLRDTLIPVSEVAERVGFGDTANFYKTFKKHTGLKPSEYRQQNNWLIC